MRELPYTRVVNFERLAQEIAAIPGMMETDGLVLPDGTVADRARFALTGDPAVVASQPFIVHVDDDLDESLVTAITAVVEAHDGMPDPTPDPIDFGSEVPDDFEFQLAQGVADSRAYLDNVTPTNAQSIAQIKRLTRFSLYLIKRLQDRGLLR